MNFIVRRAARAAPFRLRAIDGFNGLEKCGGMFVSQMDPAFGGRRRVVFIFFSFPWNLKTWLSRMYQLVLVQIGASCVLPDVYDFRVVGP